MIPRRLEPAQPTAVHSAPEKPLGVGAQGRIEPEDGIILVAASYFEGRPALIKELRVKEGDWARAGSILAVLDGREALEKAYQRSVADVEVAKTRLSQVKAGAKQADIDALKLEIARWESENEVATTELRRYQTLRDSGIISPHDYDQKRLALDRAKRTLEAARERLKSLDEIRKEDVDVRSAELSAAMAQVEHASSQVERMVVHAPASGRVLKIHAHPGEEVGADGILELGKTDRMYVVAEVYETDVSRIRLGQKAEISSELLTEKLVGTVSQIATQVSRSEFLPLDPAAFADTRVLKVKIKLENGERVAGLIYGKVNVVIHP